MYKHQIIFNKNSNYKTGNGLLGNVNEKLNTMPLLIKQFMSKHGDELIRKVTICRTPLSKVFTMIGNLLTRGDWKIQLDKLGYDNVYHLYIIVELDSGTYRIEKNSRVEITTKINRGKDNIDFFNIPEMTILGLFEQTEDRIGSEKMWRYDPFSTNCQNFVLALLDTMQLTTDEAVTFVLQQASELVQSDMLKSIAKGVTDAHAIGLHTIQGGKIKPKRKAKVKRAKRAELVYF
jgi:hypothetical protein